MYCKIPTHDRRKFSSTLCTAKRNRRYNIRNSINTNNSTSVEQNSKTLAQNKLNTCQSIQNLVGLLPNSCTQLLLSLEPILLQPTLFALFVSLVVFFVVFFVVFVNRASAHIYSIDKSHAPSKLLE